MSWGWRHWWSSEKWEVKGCTPWGRGSLKWEEQDLGGDQVEGQCISSKGDLSLFQSFHIWCRRYIFELKNAVYPLSVSTCRYMCSISLQKFLFSSQCWRWGISVFSRNLRPGESCFCPIFWPIWQAYRHCWWSFRLRVKTELRIMEKAGK